MIQIIRDLKEDKVVFELEKGSQLLSNSANLKLMKKTGEVMGKEVKVRTNDPMGRILALKAEVLDGGSAAGKAHGTAVHKVKRSDVRPRFSDIVRPKSHAPTAVASPTPKLAKHTPSTYIKSAQTEYAEAPVKKASKGNFTKIFILVMVVLVLIVFGLAVLLPTADITIYARSEPITRDLEMNVDKTVAATNADKLTIPGVMVSREVSQTKHFDTTGVKLVGAKATGTVTIYNFTKNTLTLKASTTTLVANGKKFVFTKDVTGIRPTGRIGTGADEEVDATTLIPPVAVVADQPGADYNLAASTKFTIVNAALGNTTNVYATSGAAFTGGTSKSIKVVSQQDIDKAVATMSDTIASQAETDLNAEQTDGSLKILSSGITKEVLAKTTNKNVGDEADSFDMTMIAKVSGLAFKSDDVKNLILQKINSVLSDDKYILPDAKDNLTLNYKTVDLPNGRGLLSVHYETVAAYKVNADDMSKLLAGKNANEIKEILLTKPEIDRVDVQFSPFFVNKAPKLNGKIYIHSMLSQG